MTTLPELRSELAKINERLQTAWLQERESVRLRIAEMAVEFQLSPHTVAKDIEAALRSSPPAPSGLRPPRLDLPLRKTGAAQHIETKYRNAATGDGWTGRGARPRWLREALETGALLEDYAVSGSEHLIANDPLREFQDAARREKLNGKR